MGKDKLKKALCFNCFTLTEYNIAIFECPKCKCRVMSRSTEYTNKVLAKKMNNVFNSLDRKGLPPKENVTQLSFL